MNKYSVSAILSGCFFGFAGFFTTLLLGAHFSRMGILLVRCIVASLLFGIQILLTDRGLFRIRLKDLWLFLAVGLAGQLLFSHCYYHAIPMIGIANACILLYLCPAFVAVFARLLFGDKMGRRGILAVAVCIVGCALVSGLGSPIEQPLGILYGLGSAVAFALINVLDRMLLNRGYKGTTVNFYLCVIAALGAAVLTDVGETMRLTFADGRNLLLAVGIGVVTGFLPYLFFSYALSGCESGKVSIFASTEPIVATLLGVLVFHEPFGVFSVIGIVLVLLSVVLLNTKSREDLGAGA